MPLDTEKSASPEYAPEIVSVPSGAAEELQVPLPFVSVAVQRVVGPVVNATDPVGLGSPAVLVDTVTE